MVRAYSPHFSQYTQYTRFRVRKINLLFTVLSATGSVFPVVLGSAIANCSLLQRNVDELYIRVHRPCQCLMPQRSRGIGDWSSPPFHHLRHPPPITRPYEGAGESYPLYDAYIRGLTLSLAKNTSIRNSCPCVLCNMVPCFRQRF
jgi:hypothetical protein